MMIDPNDKSGRLMIRAAEGKGDYTTSPEGIDNDGDGRINEDGIGGLDLHRNYVENWRPMPGLDLTGRGWTQGGGRVPSLRDRDAGGRLFLLQHPNVSVGQTMDTTVPMLLHGPSTSRMEESMFPEDMKIYKYFDEEGKEDHRIQAAGDTYWDYANQGGAKGPGAAAGPAARSRSWPARADAGAPADRAHPTPAEPRGSPLFGHSPDFGYLYYGAVWYGDELWNGGRIKDYDGDGRVMPLEQLRFIDEELGGKYFIPWHKFNHPTLGEVELGGFSPKFWNQNPPPEILEEWIKKEGMFNLFLYKSLPQVKIVSSKIQPIKKETDTYEIVGVFTNEGYLPTALKMADRVKIVRPDAVQISLPAGLEFVGSRARQEIGYLQSKQMKEVRWKVKGKLNPGAEAEVSISSTRGGVEKARVKLAG